MHVQGDLLFWSVCILTPYSIVVTACFFVFLLGDFSSPSNLNDSETMERIRLIIDSHDPDIVDDLRQ